MSAAIFVLAALAAAAPNDFDHGFHMSLKVQCLNCHVRTPQSEKVEDSLLPTLEACQGCHPQQSQGGEASVLAGWLRDWKKRQAQPRDLEFSHKAHLELGYGGENSCLPCHKGVEAARSATKSPAIPSMPTCGACHDIKDNSQECGRCHLRQKALVLKPLDHDGGFLRAHRSKASADKEACLRCHTESWCSDCHATLNLPAAASARPSHHEPGHRAFHPLEARMDASKCQRCHAQKECQDCHEAFRKELNSPSHRDRFQEVHAKGGAGGSGESFEAAWGDGCRACHNPMDGKYAFNFDEWHGDHAASARADIQACRSCHAEKPDCTNCHALGLRSDIFDSNLGPDPMGISPHDQQFVASVNRPGGPAHRGPANCMTCHTRADLCSETCHGAK